MPGVAPSKCPTTLAWMSLLAAQPAREFLGKGRRTGQGATFGPEGGDLGGGPARAKGSPAGGQGGTEAFRGMQAGSAGGLQHTPRALRIWADRGTCTAQVACARGPRGAGHSTTGYCAAAQASVVDMVGRMWRHVGFDACEMLWSGCGVAVWSAVRWERLLEGFAGRLVVLTHFNSEL